MKFPAFALNLALLGALCGAPITASAAVVFSNIYAFGDSLTDTGNTSLASGGAYPGAAYYNGRYSDGPLWIETMAGNLGLAAPTPSLAGGNNFAFAGAYSATGGLVPTISQQITMFTGGGGFFQSTDLVVLWGGANDFILGGQTDPNIPAANILSLIPSLAAAGAKSILLPNLPDLGDTPELLATGNALAIAGFSQLSLGFNQTLAAQIPGLEASLGIDIIPLDIYAIGKQLRNNPSAYGFTNTTQSALLTGNGANAAGYIYWDGVHPTSRVHGIFAQGIPEPGSMLLLCFAGAGWATRRHRAA